MIPERTGVTVDSTVQGEDVAMSIDQSALAHIMNVLTDLYVDPELAVIREYSTNALDSHIAGYNRAAHGAVNGFAAPPLHHTKHERTR